MKALILRIAPPSPDHAIPDGFSLARLTDLISVLPGVEHVRVRPAGSAVSAVVFVRAPVADTVDQLLSTLVPRLLAIDPWWSGWRLAARCRGTEMQDGRDADAPARQSARARVN